MSESGKFAVDLIGVVASVAGFLLSLYVLKVAKGARRAAEEARALARKRDLVEELGDASQKLQQVGNFLQRGEWLGVQIRTAEVLAIGNHVRSVEVSDRVLFSPEDRHEVEIAGDDYMLLRERDIHAVAASRVEPNTGLYL